jgi:hypothetical protein
MHEWLVITWGMYISFFFLFDPDLSRSKASVKLDT